MQTLGRTVLTSFPELGLTDVRAKADTGAYKCALHCHNVRVMKSTNGRRTLSVQLVDPAQPNYDNKELRFKEFARTRVTSSFGHQQVRYVVRLKVKIGGKIYKEDFTLADRSKMRNPVLLGRSLLKGRFMVDVSKFRIKVPE